MEHLPWLFPIFVCDSDVCIVVVKEGNPPYLIALAGKVVHIVLDRGGHRLLSVL